jgi:hypothetical protein
LSARAPGLDAHIFPRGVAAAYRDSNFSQVKHADMIAHGRAGLGLARVIDRLD